jgi:glycerol-3-phosphate dehydrogenase subunit C
MTTREGSLEAPTRHPLDWTNPKFSDEGELFKEMERVFDICHGCRRCVSLCQSFPTLFDLVDESESMEVDGVAKEDYWKVVDHCYLCDLCFMTKCPYVPPHAWNLDFPHLMLRAKAFKYKACSAVAPDPGPWSGCISLGRGNPHRRPHLQIECARRVQHQGL